VPLLGICFGLQAVTQALGGHVERNPAGWDIGTTELELTEAGRRWPPLAAVPRTLRILKTHMDIAVRLPPGAVVLARSGRVPVEVYTVGERVLCLQGHPELDAEIVGELIDKRERLGLLDAQRAADGRASLRLPPQRDFLQRWLQTFLREGRVPAAA
jgi:GMP synthase-like glutamine amidotransferase